MHRAQGITRRRSVRALPLVLGVLITSGVVLALGPLDPPPGPPLPTMKTLDAIEPRIDIRTLSGNAAALHVITQPGSYYLTRSIVGVSGKGGIRIASDDVTIDLNGYTLQGVPGSIDGIEIGDSIVPINNVTIRNGVVRDWGRRGIDGDLANNTLIDAVRAFRNGETGIRAGAGVSPPMGPVVRNCVSQGNALNGFQIENGVIESCVAADNLARGINALGSTVSNCVATNNDSDGIGGSGSILNCVAVANGIDGINFSGTVADSRVSNNGNDGIELAPGSSVRDCRTSVNGSAGVRAGDACQVSRVNARQNQIGILLASASVARDNLCDTNTDAGIRADLDANRIEQNTLTNNLRGLDVNASGNLIVRNSASLNATDFDIVAGNTLGPIVVGGGTIASEHPWANFSY